MECDTSPKFIISEKLLYVVDIPFIVTTICSIVFSSLCRLIGITYSLIFVLSSANTVTLIFVSLLSNTTVSCHNKLSPDSILLIVLPLICTVEYSFANVLMRF